MSTFNLTPRAVLAGLGALTAPSAAIAVAGTAVSGQDTLASVIAYHDEIWAQCKAVGDFIADLEEGDTAPSLPFVQLTELGADHGFLGPAPKWDSVEEIDAYFDGCRKSAEWHVKHGFSPDEHGRRIERLSAKRATAKQMLADRKAAYKAWEDETGITAAQVESDRLYEIQAALEERITSWPIQTLDEARRVAAFLTRRHYGRVPSEDAARFLALFVQEVRS